MAADFIKILVLKCRLLDLLLCGVLFTLLIIIQTMYGPQSAGLVIMALSQSPTLPMFIHKNCRIGVHAVSVMEAYKLKNKMPLVC